MLAIPGRIIASCFALVGFAAAIVVGWAAGNSTTTVLWKAIVALAVCYAAGRVLGSIAERAVQQDVERFKREHPLPTPGPVASPSPQGHSSQSAEAA